jgi:hypothetical protein
MSIKTQKHQVSTHWRPPAKRAFAGLVTGHYQPLANNLGLAPKSDQTGSLQSNQKTLQNPFIGFALCSVFNKILINPSLVLKTINMYLRKH